MTSAFDIYPTPVFCKKAANNGSKLRRKTSNEVVLGSSPNIQLHNDEKMEKNMRNSRPKEAVVIPYYRQQIRFWTGVPMSTNGRA